MKGHSPKQICPGHLLGHFSVRRPMFLQHHSLSCDRSPDRRGGRQVLHPPHREAHGLQFVCLSVASRCHGLASAIQQNGHNCSQPSIRLPHPHPTMIHTLRSKDQQISMQSCSGGSAIARVCGETQRRLWLRPVVNVRVPVHRILNLMTRRHGLAWSVQT